MDRAAGARLVCKPVSQKFVGYGARYIGLGIRNSIKRFEGLDDLGRKRDAHGSLLGIEFIVNRTTRVGLYGIDYFEAGSSDTAVDCRIATR